MLEAGVEMWFQAQLNDDRVVVAVDVGVDSIKALEDLTYQGWECFREGYTCSSENRIGQDSSIGDLDDEEDETNRFCWGTLIRCQCCPVPRPSGAQRIRVLPSWLVS